MGALKNKRKQPLKVMRDGWNWNEKSPGMKFNRKKNFHSVFMNNQIPKLPVQIFLHADCQVSLRARQ
jgi:hypothetical protein